MSTYQQVVNQPFLYVSGMEMTYVSATTISIAAGACRDVTNTFDINVPNATTLSLAANGINGLDQGAVAASSIYDVYAIMSPLLSHSSQASGYIASLNTANAPFLPPSYSEVRHVGWIVTASDTTIQKFIQSGHNNERTYWYDTAIQTAAITLTSTYSTVDLSVGVPPLLHADVKLTGVFTAATAGDTATVTPFSTSLATTPVTAVISGPVISQATPYQIYTAVGIGSGKAEVSVKSSAASGDTITMFVASYKDSL